MNTPEFYAAVYWIIENEKWEVLFLQRSNTWFMDGKFWLPAGHLEWFESLRKWAIREIKEEIWVDVSEDDLELIHNSHRTSTWERVYFDFYFKVHAYSGEIKNCEEDKCSGLAFLDKNDERIVPYLRDVFERISKWEKFSEIVFK